MILRQCDTVFPKEEEKTAFKHQFGSFSLELYSLSFYLQSRCSTVCRKTLKDVILTLVWMLLRQIFLLKYVRKKYYIKIQKFLFPLGCLMQDKFNSKQFFLLVYEWECALSRMLCKSFLCKDSLVRSVTNLCIPDKWAYFNSFIDFILKRFYITDNTDIEILYQIFYIIIQLCTCCFYYFLHKM